MDPEDLREIISAYQKCVAETVQRFEDDAEGAVRAGLELVAAVSVLKTHARIVLGYVD
jgi:hypothetical protein